ncbi:ATP-binding protein [Aquipseudomonas alcaligenes]|uniref:ATP-binding protein n=1 Tax=Aquipseudomonas alcaligenes TaxID=43263 RepID=UPI000DFCEB69|nr:ATP-binding protein [Pseudomonas alcaligenes]SUD14104.1 Predicted ATPase [Pseudomonas alcaligenes]
MRLKSIRYEEYRNDPRHWVLNTCELDKINLVVGKNSTGKSRLIHVISSIASLLSGKRPNIFESGHWDIELEAPQTKIQYSLSIEEGKVEHESIIFNDRKMMYRDNEGEGEIWYEEEKRFIKFRTPEDKIAATQKKDDLQHPFFTPLYIWADRVELHSFGTDFGRSEAITTEQLGRIMENDLDIPDRKTPTVTYIKGYQKFKEEFDKAVIDDMQKLGYSLTDVGCRPIETGVSALPTQLFGLFLREDGCESWISQVSMSQGQFRALALTIYINYLAFTKTEKFLLIDDVGEGLDYERSLGMIDVLMEKCQKGSSQIIMTSNDKFVMNKVPLSFWTILRRDKNIVTGYTERNSREKFENFQFMGLNNFDLFSSDII